MSNIEPKSNIWCIHFTGIQSNYCDAGVVYRDIWDNSRRLPCILDSGSTSVCPHLQPPTQEQVALYEQQMQETLNQLLADMQNGICPHCGKKLEWEQQIGRCAYGSCGCRLWQGKARTKAQLMAAQNPTEAPRTGVLDEARENVPEMAKGADLQSENRLD